jgi:hypothetical protein
MIDPHCGISSGRLPASGSRAGVLPALPRPIRWALRKLFFLTFDLVERLLRYGDEMVPRQSAIFTFSHEAAFRR